MSGYKKVFDKNGSVVWFYKHYTFGDHRQISLWNWIPSSLVVLCKFQNDALNRARSPHPRLWDVAWILKIWRTSQNSEVFIISTLGILSFCALETFTCFLLLFWSLQEINWVLSYSQKNSPPLCRVQNYQFVQLNLLWN